MEIMIDNIRLSFICEIMEQHGRVHEMKKQLKSIKIELDEIGNPEPDYYCTMYPDEHGEDYEYYEKKGRKEYLTYRFNSLLKQKISGEKLLKKMKHQFREFQEGHVAPKDHINLDVYISRSIRQRDERRKNDLKFKSKSGELVGEMILNIISIRYNGNVRRFVSKDIAEFSNTLESDFRRSENEYIRRVMPKHKGGGASRFKVAKYMATEFYKNDQATIDILFNAMNVVSQIDIGLKNEDDENVMRKSKNFRDNLRRLVDQYNDISKQAMYELPMKTI